MFFSARKLSLGNFFWSRDDYGGTGCKYGITA